MLANLAQNAYEAMPDGGELTIRVDYDADHAFCKVRDTGVGIPTDTIESIFEPLFTTKAEGVGLGLAICRNLVEANAGRLTVESAIGVGTTFALELPRC